MAGRRAVAIRGSEGAEGGRAARFLKKHPDGVGTLNFEVENIETTFRLLEERGGTPIQDIERATDSKGGTLAWFSITTPFGDTTFRFVERKGYLALFPGFAAHPTQLPLVPAHSACSPPFLRFFHHITGNPVCQGQLHISPSLFLESSSAFREISSENV